MFIAYHDVLLEVYLLHKHTQKNDHYKFLLEFRNCSCNTNFLPLFTKQPPKAILKNFTIYTGKHLCWCLFLIKFETCNAVKKRLQLRCFPVNIAKFLRTPILKNICKWLLLSVSIGLQNPSHLHQVL